MASLLATLVLDDAAMDIVKQRGEGHLVFEATLSLVRGGCQHAPCHGLPACTGGT
jgi:hypothetical protein